MCGITAGRPSLLSPAAAVVHVMLNTIYANASATQKCANGEAKRANCKQCELLTVAVGYWAIGSSSSYPPSVKTLEHVIVPLGLLA